MVSSVTPLITLSFLSVLYCGSLVEMKNFLNMKRKREKRDVAITVRLPASTVASLKTLSNDKKNSQSWVIEEAIRLFSKKFKTVKEKNETNL